MLHIYSDGDLDNGDVDGVSERDGMGGGVSERDGMGGGVNERDGMGGGMGGSAQWPEAQ